MAWLSSFVLTFIKMRHTSIYFLQRPYQALIILNRHYYAKPNNSRPKQHCRPDHDQFFDPNFGTQSSAKSRRHQRHPCFGVVSRGRQGKTASGIQAQKRLIYAEFRLIRRSSASKDARCLPRSIWLRLRDFLSQRSCKSRLIHASRSANQRTLLLRTTRFNSENYYLWQASFLPEDRKESARSINTIPPRSFSQREIPNASASPFMSEEVSALQLQVEIIDSPTGYTITHALIPYQDYSERHFARDKLRRRDIRQGAGALRSLHRQDRGFP